MKNQNVSDAFRDLFLPNGQAPLSGLFTRRLDLAAILDAVADKGISEFYSGNLAQEMVAAVRKINFSLIILAVKNSAYSMQDHVYATDTKSSVVTSFSHVILLVMIHLCKNRI